MDFHFNPGVGQRIFVVWSDREGTYREDYDNTKEAEEKCLELLALTLLPPTDPDYYGTTFNLICVGQELTVKPVEVVTQARLVLSPTF